MSNKIYYHIILDQSGSMQDVLNPTISSFNEQMQVIKSIQKRFPEQEIYVGLTTFNDEIVHQYYCQQSFHLQPLNTHNYRPNGTTALYDAIGTTSLLLQTNIKDILEGSVVVVILTDGHENASKTFSFDAIANLIKELESTGKWTFSYLGATPDAVEIAAALNIKKKNSMSFDKKNINGTMQKLSCSFKQYIDKKQQGITHPDFLNSDSD